ncbi:hypothetical protein CHARACLAT_003361 [Characodon lateralis]|uniref:Uncharacterized protein n=1 Tax=Characodon lateralis TaxID=208331 RepID=A0ABU7EJA1_9TELE|nr:hypothetical protein [Characodon lateralis]
MSLSAAAPAPFLDLDPDLHWLCVVLLKGVSPQMIPTVLKDCCEAYSFLFFPYHEIDISHHFLPLATSLEVLPLTHSSSSAHPLPIPQLVFTFDKHTLRSLFSTSTLGLQFE